MVCRSRSPGGDGRRRERGAESANRRVLQAIARLNPAASRLLLPEPGYGRAALEEIEALCRGEGWSA